MIKIQFAYSMHPVDGEYVGFIRRTVNEHTVINIGRFKIEEDEWENFKKEMEKIAEVYWSWN